MSFVRVAPEQHDTLEGVPEPQENPRLVGHEANAGALLAAHRAGKLHHGLIFAGPQGIGKATFAFHLAHHLLTYADASAAPDRLAVPDPASQLWRLIANGSHPSVLYLTRPLNERTKSFRGAVTVEEVRRVNRFLSLKAHDGGWRFVIIDPADDMNTNAANALLKNLEEPPARTLFILISHAAGGLLATIRSRCQTVRFAALPQADLAAAIGGLGLEQDVPDAILVRAEGSVREAILLSEYGGLEIRDAIERGLAEKTFDARHAYRIADTVAGRDQTTPFALFNRFLLDLAAERGSSAAGRNDLGRAERAAKFWQDARLAIDQMEAYNLDKRLHVLGMMRQAHAALSA